MHESFVWNRRKQGRSIQNLSQQLAYKWILVLFRERCCNFKITRLWKCSLLGSFGKRTVLVSVPGQGAGTLRISILIIAFPACYIISPPSSEIFPNFAFLLFVSYRTIEDSKIAPGRYCIWYLRRNRDCRVPGRHIRRCRNRGALLRRQVWHLLLVHLRWTSPFPCGFVYIRCLILLL